MFDFDISDANYIPQLIKYLNDRTKEYDEGHPTISDKEWDDLYFKLEQLEQKTGIYYPNSPTHNIIYTTVNNLKKLKHNHKMLSLDKTKSIDEVQSFLGNKDFVAMAKMDGLTCSLRYINGELVSAETRGNGLIGEDITHNAMVIPSIPKKISNLNETIVDGEVICTYKNFEPFSGQYKNPRNFASGSIRLLNSKECAARNLTFIAWDLIKGDIKNNNSFKRRLITLAQLGFEVVPWVQENLAYAVKDIQDVCKQEGYPIDGLVFKFNNISYGNSLGETDHHFKNAIAYKFYDEEFETRLFNIEWSMGRTGILTPVAVFEPVDTGTNIVDRASLHNLSILKNVLGKRPYKGQKIKIILANQIIPQVIWGEQE